MKKIFFIIFSVVYSISFAEPGKIKLTGKVTDKDTKEMLVGISVYFPDLKIGTLTKADGTYSIDNLPAAKSLVKVTGVGYATLTETIDLTATTVVDFILERSVTEMSEVVITGVTHSSDQKKVPTPIAVVPHEQLLQNSSSNIIDAIAKVPGVSQLSTGVGISKPVIRGLGYNRVVVMNDGIRQEGQQWGSEHGIEIDEFSVNRIEILKGPSSLVYGSDAMAGVINMISFPTLPEGTIQGNALATYQSNNGQVGLSGNFSGNTKGFIYDLRYSKKQAHAYHNQYDGYVFGSGFKENTFSGILGLNRSWGYSHLHFSAYHLTPGIVEGERDSLTGKFVEPLVLNDTVAVNTIVGDNEMKSYSIGVPYQDVQHYKAALNSNFVIGNGSVKSVFGFQQNRRKEFTDVFNPADYGLYFLLNSFNYSMQYLLPEHNNWKSSFGLSGMYQNSLNKGKEFLIPEYSLFDMGGFFTTQKSFNEKVSMTTGLRYDLRTENGKQLYVNDNGIPVTLLDSNSYLQFKGFKSHFSALSGSLGFSYLFSGKVFMKANLSRGFRAPNIAELGSNGEHEGTSRYEIGNPSMKAETNLEFDYSFGINSQHVTTEINFFTNSISNFIYLKKLNSVLGGDSIVDISNPIPTFKYNQGSASFIGGEVTVDVHPHPLDWLHFENSFSIVNAMQKNASDSTKYLPFTPSPKFISQLKAEKDKWGTMLKNLFVKAEAEVYLKQNKIYYAYGTETKTNSYVLLNLGIGAQLTTKTKELFSFSININNITDVAYQNHLSRLKYLPENYATGRTGVYNMGRNIAVKLVVPFEIRKPKD